MRSIVRTVTLAALAAAPSLAAAQAAPTSGFRAEYLKQLAGVEKQLVSLAEAIPQDKYGWRPGKGVRSIGEVYLHIAGSNFMIDEAIGTKPPVAMGKDFETKDAMNKAVVVDMLKQGFANARQSAMHVTDAELGQEVTLFGDKMTKMGVLLLLATHMHEHLGQSIAYARTNNIVPPWSKGNAGM